MAEKFYLELLARLLIIVIATPILLQLVEGVVSSLDIIASVVQATVVRPETVVQITITILLGFSLILLMASIVYLDPLLYSLSLLPLLIVFPERGLITGFNVSSVLIIMLFSSTILQGYRDGQVASYRIEGLLRLTLSIAAITVIIAIASYIISITFWSYIKAVRGVEVGSDVLKPFIRFLSGNPLGLAFIIIALLAGLYSISTNIMETLILYLRPSKKIAVKALALDFQAPIKSPLTSLRNAMVTLSLSPIIYTIILKALPFLSIPESPGSIQWLEAIAIRWVLSIAVLALTWLLVTRAMTRFDEKEPGLESIIASLALIVIVYMLLYIAQLWDPRVEGLNLGRADAQLLSIVASYYKTLFSIAEIIPILIGLAP